MLVMMLALPAPNNYTVILIENNIRWHLDRIPVLGLRRRVVKFEWKRIDSEEIEKEKLSFIHMKEMIEYREQEEGGENSDEDI